jgi:hypothetical protein
VNTEFRWNSSPVVVLTITALAVVGQPQAAKTPMMGWASWNAYGENISESIIKTQADAIVTAKLLAAGYNYLNIDDGFFDGRNADGSLKIKADMFPSGFKSLVDYIHSKGLKAGFYSDAGHNTCASFGTNGDARELGSGLYGHDQQDIDLAFKTWGFDYIKVDYCGAGWSDGLDEQTRYTAIRKAIDATGRTDIAYNVCRWQFPGGWVTKIADSWRIGADINPWGFDPVTRILDTNTYLAGMASQGHYNDMDMLEVGNGLSDDQARAHFALWCIHSSPLVLGNDMTKMSSTTVDILTNPEVLALDQDTTGLQATRISDDGNGGQVFAKRLNGLASNERGVVLFNRSGSSRSITVNWKDLDLTGSATVRDLWNKKDLGSFTNSFSSSVPATGCVAIRVTGDHSNLQELFEAEFAYMNNYNWTKDRSIQPNQAKPILDSKCSRGAKVTYLGNGDGKSDSNYIEFRNIWAYSAGTYHATLYFLSGDSRSATVTVNGHDTLLNGLTSGSYTSVDSVRFPVVLKGGSNTIRFANSTGYLPDLDALRVDVNSVPPTSIQDRHLAAVDVNVQTRGDLLTLQVGGDLQEARIYDVSGVLWASSNQKSIQIGKLKAGTYLVNVRTAAGTALKAFTKI